MKSLIAILFLSFSILSIILYWIGYRSFIRYEVNNKERFLYRTKVIFKLSLASFILGVLILISSIFIIR